MRFDEDFVEVHRLTEIDSMVGDHLFLDLIAAVSPIAQEILKQRIRLAWQNKEIWMVSREGLIQLKEVSRRPKDLLDIEALQQGKS